MYEEYQKAYTHYSSIYGENTAIFYLVGKFYEMYDWLDKSTGLPGTSILKVVDILGIQLSVRKGDGPDGMDGYFAGVPEQSLHKYAGLLTKKGWVVVIYDQVKNANGSVRERVVSRVLTPGTHVEVATNDAYYVGGIWLEDAVWGSKNPPKFALSTVDLTTGRVYTYEGIARGKHSSWSVDDAIHFFQVYSPKECTLWWRGDQIVCPSIDSLKRQFGLHCSLHMYNGMNQGGLEIPLVREDFLRRTFRVQSLLPIRESLGISEALLSERILCSILQRIEEIFPSGSQKFYPPSKWSPKTSLFLGNQALIQLNMITLREDDSVLGLFLGTQTVFGKRAMRNRILYPRSDPVELEKSYQEIEVFNELADTSTIANWLKQIGDLPRLHRRIMCGDVTIHDVINIDQSYTRAIQISQALSKTVLAYKSPNSLHKINTTFENVFSVEKALKSLKTPDTSFCFQPGKSKLVDDLENELSRLSDDLTNILSTITKWVGLKPDAIRYDFKETMSPTIVGPKGSLVALKNAMDRMTHPFKEMEIVNKKSSSYLEIKDVSVIWNKIQKKKGDLQDAIRISLIPICDEISKELSNHWDELESWLALIDISYTIWKRSKEYGFVKPVLTVREESYVDIEGLRHPLIERQSSRVEYVKHNVCLGSNDTTGWLVYGMNASGKSSLMKAVGVAVLLAQAGCYVPAKSFHFTPFESLFTRILNTDNLWAGLSSFAVEMTELREILNRSNEKTLVLGDELCSGTESISATALVGASLEYLHNLRVKFIFATHFHGILTIPSIVALDMLKVWHLKVKYDHASDTLVYERTLTPGAGSSLYGLEVAKAMNLPEEILLNAHQIRRTLLGTSTVVDAPSSKWNSEIQRRICEVCEKEIVSDLEVHHIKPRADTVLKRNDDGTHQNDLRNLIVVCSKCHDDVHSEKIAIGSVVQTSEGPRRTIVKSEEKAPTSGKWDAEEVAMIEEYLKKYPCVQPKRAVFDLDLKGIKITTACLKSFRKKL